MTGLTQTSSAATPEPRPTPSQVADVDRPKATSKPRSGVGKLLVASVLFAAQACWLATADANAAVQGTLIERHGDTLQGREVAASFVVAGGSQHTVLTDPQPTRLIGQQVVASDSDPTRAGIQGQARAVNPSQHLQASPPTGPQTVLVLVLTTPDDLTPAVPDAETARQRIFTDPHSAAVFFAQQSRGATTLTGRVNANGDVLGPIALSTPMAGCPYDAIAAEADKLAAAQGDQPSAYDHVIYLMPGGHCSFAGLGELPGHRVWSSGDTTSRVIAHELGHNMGAHHANLLSCTDQGGAPIPYSTTCSSAEYGDPFDVMGWSSALMGAFHRYQVGQLPAAQVVSLHQSRTITLAATDDLAATGARLVMVPIKVAHQAVHDYFAIELRGAPSPFDGWLQGDPVTTGLTIRKVNDATGRVLQTQLIDMHPSQSVSFAGEEAALQPGETFTDAGDNVSITSGTDSSGALQATVMMPTLVDDVPPSPPAVVTPAGNTGGVHLSWTPGTDDVAVDHYRLTRDGLPLGTADGLSFDDPNVQTSTRATYGVSTVDTSGNGSPETTVTITLADVTPPTPPVGLQVRRNPDGTAALAWLAATDNRGVTGYRIVQDGRDLGYVSGTALQVPSDRHAHTFGVYARDAAANESAPATGALGEQAPPAVPPVVIPGGQGAQGGQGGPTAPPPAMRPGRPVLRATMGRTVRVPGGRRFTVTFRAPGASGLRVMLGARRIGLTRRGVITVPVFVANRRHVTLTIIVYSAAGEQHYRTRLT